MLSLVLVLVMVFGALPSASFSVGAQETDTVSEGQSTSSTDPEAKKDSKKEIKKEKDQKAEDKKEASSEKSDKKTSEAAPEKTKSSEEPDKKNSEKSSEKTESVNEADKKESKESSDKTESAKASDQTKVSDKTTADEKSKETSANKEEAQDSTPSSEKTTSAKGDTSDSTANKKEAEKDSGQTVAEESSTETVKNKAMKAVEGSDEEVSDNLKVDNYRIWLNGDELSAGSEVKDGDELTLAFDWKRVNNDKHLTYKYPIDILNIRIDEKNGASLKADGVEIGTYDLKEITENDKKFLQFDVYLTEEKVKNHSNIGGGVILSGVVDIDSDKTLPDKTAANIQFGDKDIDVVYRNQGEVSFGKTGGKLNEDGTITYEITVNYKDIIKNPVVTDTLDANTQLLTDSFKITYKEDDGSEAEVTDALKSQVTFTQGGTDNHCTGFSLALPEGTEKKTRHTYVISYNVKVLDEPDFSKDEKKTYVQISNNANFNYTDDQGDEHNPDAKVDTRVNKPSVDKTGTFLADNKGTTPSLYQRTNNHKYYWTKWTISLDLKDYQKMLSGDMTSAVITDTMGSSIPAGDIGVYFSLFSNPSNYTGALSSLYEYGKNTGLSSEKGYDPALWLDNGRKLLSKKIAEDVGNTSPSFIYTEDVTPEDFIYDEKTGKYTMTYVIPMPSEGSSSYNLTASNTVTMEVFDNPVTKTTTIQADLPKEDLLIKGPDDYDGGPSYNASSYGDAGNLTYSKTVEADKEYTTIDWLVGINPGRLKNGLTGSDVNDMISSVGGLTLTDHINGHFQLVQTGQNTYDYKNQTHPQTMGTINLEDVRVAVFNSGVPVTGEVDASYYSAWMTRLREYYKAREAAYEELKSASDATAGLINSGGTGSEEWGAAYSAWNTANNTYNTVLSAQGFMGELTYADFNAISGASISGGSGSITVTIPQTGISLKRYFLDPTGKETSGGGPNLSLQSIVGGNYQIIVYIPAKISGNVKLGTTATSFFNDSSLEITPTSNAKVTDFPTYVVNAEYDVKKELPDDDPGTVSVSKANGNLELSDKTFAYSDADEYTVGWRIAADMKEAKPGNTLTIKDTLPEGLNFDADSLISFVSKGNGMKQAATSYEENALPKDYYTIQQSGGTIDITVEYTEELKQFLKDKGDSRYIMFYFRTEADDSLFYEDNEKKVSFANTAESVWADTPPAKATSTAQLTFPQFVDKNAVDAEGKITGTPVVDDANGVISANYQLDINPEAASVVLDEEGKAVANGTYTVTDKMTEVMALDKASIKVSDADSGNEVSGWSYQYDEDTHTLTLIVPDGKHLKASYKVTFEVDPIADPAWMSAKNTKNSVSLSAANEEAVPSDTVDFSSFEAGIHAWSYMENGKFSLFKYEYDQEASDGRKPVTQAAFTLQSVYDNLGNTYAGEDDIDTAYQNGIKITESTGIYDFTELPLDRIYKLEETEVPEGYEASANKTIYFLLQDADKTDWTDDNTNDAKAYLKELEGKDVNFDTIQTGDTLEVENYKLIDLKGKKTWKGDENYKTDVRPDNIKIQLYRYTDDKNASEEVQFSSDQIKWTDKNTANWSYTISGLRKYADDQKLYKYYVEEEEVPMYTTEVTADKDGNELDITNTFETVEVTGTKTWEKDSAYKDYRPDNITLTLYADEEPADTSKYKVKWTDTDTDEWTYTITGLPRYRFEESDSGNGNTGENGNSKKLVEITYTVEEEPVKGYSATYSDNLLNITNTFELVDVSVEKKWEDKENQDNVRPESISIQLLAGNEEVSGKSVTLQADANGKWSYTFENLPKYSKSGTEISYTVKETLPAVTDNEGNTGESLYTLTGNKEDSTGTIVLTNSYTTETTSLTVKKVWTDEENAEQIRPESITVQLQADGKDIGEPVVLNADNRWTHLFNDLDKKKAGNDITYSIIETDCPEGYQVTYSDIEDDTITVTNTHEVKRTKVSVTKVWEDEEDQDGVRPDDITVYLVADDMADTSHPVTLNEGNNWSYTWENLLVSSKGKEITYSIEEAMDEDSDAEYPADKRTLAMTGTAESGYSFTMTNTHQAYEIDVTAEKIWEDGDNRDGIRPDEVEVQLYADGKAVEAEGLVNPVRLNEENRWSYTWKGLSQRTAGKDIVYTLEETSVPEGYTSSKADSADNVSGADGTLQIKNTHASSKISISGKKVWNDNDNQDGTRPESVVIHLLADNVEVDRKTVTAEDDWAFTFTDLYQYREGEHGQEIVYSLVESAVSGYTSAIAETEDKDSDAAHEFTVTNTHTAGKISITAVKVWEDKKDQDELRPDSITIQLMADGEASGDPVTLNEENNWRYQFDDLDEKANGETITYTVVETNVPEDYKVSYSDLSEDGFITVKNTHKVEEDSEEGSASTTEKKDTTKKGDSQKNKTTSKSASTGDNNNPEAWFALLLLSIMGLSAIMIYRRRQDKGHL